MIDQVQSIPGRMESIRTYKENGGSVAAVLPIHYPRALFRAFGILPVEVWGPPAVDTSYGSNRLQPYVCSIVRNALSFLETGGLDVADIIVVPHACDSLQGLGSVLIDFVAPRQPVLPIYLPRGKRESDIAFLAAEFSVLFDRLAILTGQSPSEDQLLLHITREEVADARLGQLYQKRRRLPLDDLAFYRLVRSREYLPAEVFIKAADAALTQMTDALRDGIPIVLSGIVPEPMSVLAAISKTGGIVVGDDMACCGRRLYPAGHSQEPFLRMAERILFGPPDPTRGNSIRERFDYLQKLVSRTKAWGVVFYDVKFCEPELFDLPDLRRLLREAAIPSLAVEVDIGEPLSYQVRTRLESFLEMSQ
ncbi:MAG TPA: 2-hydroxyacyl-CoA dehydratase family protein [Anaerolineae bacterium]|jgi:benzoyl-CoA reductase/2-hydroxyglutaryl-CoA dehydratase subunit BcrC/BadD/HgdB|nr:2-hydroxyacyl-CoA dehydratase family protein [Anaerolineae bacterium]